MTALIHLYPEGSPTWVMPMTLPVKAGPDIAVDLARALVGTVLAGAHTIGRAEVRVAEGLRDEEVYWTSDGGEEPHEQPAREAG